MLVAGQAVERARKGLRRREIVDPALVMRLADAAFAIVGSVSVPLIYQTIFGLGGGELSRFALFGVVVAILFVFVNEYRGLYRVDALMDHKGQSIAVSWNWLGVWGFLAVVAIALKASEGFSRAVGFSLALGGVPVLVTTRLLFAHHLDQARDMGVRSRERVAVIALGGTRKLTGELRRAFAVVQLQTVTDLHGGFDVAAFVALARARRAGKVVIKAAPEHMRDVPHLLEMIRGLPLPVYVVTEPWLVDLLDRPRKISGALAGYEVRSAPLNTLERVAKRGLDIVVASLGLIFVAPLMLLSALAIKLDSKGPVFFRQSRLGFNGQPFDILKFRSMVVMENGDIVTQARPNDSRITRVGRLIRATSIDELPQLINVLRGDMSLVGPRPHAVAHDDYFDDLIADYSLRRHMKPGLTGWAQVNGARGMTPTVESMARRVELDLWYVNHWSLWLDVWIITRTAFELVKNRNVH